VLTFHHYTFVVFCANIRLCNIAPFRRFAVNDLVKLSSDKQLRTTSRIVAKVFGKAHMIVMRAVRNLDTPEDFNVDNFALIDFKDDKGRTYQEYTMSRDGFMFLCMGFTGKAAVKYKLEFIAAFNAMESRLTKENDAVEWKIARLQGKKVRSILTDTIQDFVAYAITQGSANADRYYGSITLMEYKALQMIEKGSKVGTNFRDTLDGMQIATLTVAEMVARRAMQKGMDEGLHYKEIYQLAKLEVERLASVTSDSLLTMN
jgi:Rha family phage regulatory protein